MLQLPKKIFLLLSSALILSACSLASPSPYPEVKNYVITGNNPTITKAPATKKIILVTLQSGNNLYNSTQMAYSDKPFTIAYFSKNRWANAPAQMLQPLLIQSLQKTGHFKAVINQAYGDHYDYTLTTQLNKLEQNFLVKPSQIELVLHAEIFSMQTQKIIAAHDFVIKENTAENTPYGGVMATNRAVDQLMQHVASFVIKNT